MKYLIMCEGTNEETLINLLLNNNKLTITRDDLIGRKPYHTRQLKHPVIKTDLKHYNQPVIVYRIGDTQNDTLAIPNDLKNIVSKDKIFTYCTKPEIEMLIIINENCIKQYQKSRKKPSLFVQEKFKLNGQKYNKSNDFWQDYYSGKKINNLVKNIKTYKSLKKHNKGELYLADLLKK